MTTNRRNATSEDLKNEVLAKIKDYTEQGFSESERLHELIMRANPSLYPRLWYGMPGYAKTKDSAVLCFFRKDTLISFGVTESVALDSLDSTAAGMTPSAWYISELTAEAESVVSEVVKKATA